MAFQKAVKRKLKARVAIDGPTGSGKTYTALKLARALTGAKGKIAVIDTEHKTASKYLGDAIDTFDVEEFETFEPQRYIKAINEAAEAGYDCLVIDSYSHAWAGKGGALEMVDNAAAAAQAKGWGGGKKDNFSAWREVTPVHNELVETMIRYPGHLIVTMRSKMAYEKADSGKVVKLGMQPIQRDGVEYEFDVVADMDVHHNLVISKTRCKPLDQKLFKKPEGPDIAKPLLKWLNDGAEVVEEKAVPVDLAPPAPEGEDSGPLSPGVDVPSMQTPARPEVHPNVKEAARILGGEIVLPGIETEAEKALRAKLEKALTLIESAKTKKDLRAAAATIKELDFPEDYRKEVLKEWRKKEASL